MAIKEIFGSGTRPDDSGNVFLEPASIKRTNKFFKEGVWVFEDSSTKDTIYGSVVVPSNYDPTGTTKLIIPWTSTATSGNVVFDFDHRPVAAGESLDQATALRTLTVTDAAPGTTDLMPKAEIALTAGDLAAGDVLQYKLSRDGLVGGPTDTISAAVTVTKPYLEFDIV